MVSPEIKPGYLTKIGLNISILEGKKIQPIWGSETADLRGVMALSVISRARKFYSAPPLYWADYAKFKKLTRVWGKPLYDVDGSLTLPLLDTYDYVISPEGTPKHKSLMARYIREINACLNQGGEFRFAGNLTSHRAGGLSEEDQLEKMYKQNVETLRFLRRINPISGMSIANTMEDARSAYFIVPKF